MSQKPEIRGGEYERKGGKTLLLTALLFILETEKW